MLSDPQKRRYARQILVDELGLAGQEKLCAATLQPAPGADRAAVAVAIDYLTRAGVSPLTAAGAVPPGAAEAALARLEVAGSEAVRALAGDELLVECAAWLAGAFAAVETIKDVAGVGVAGRLDPALRLRASSAPDAGRDPEAGRAAAGSNREVR